MATIHVTPEQMRAIASQVNGKINEWTQEVGSIQRIVNDMDAQWDGLGNDTFNNVFRNEVPKFNNLRTMMDDYSKAVVAAAQKYEQGEQEVKTIVNRR